MAASTPVSRVEARLPSAPLRYCLVADPAVPPGLPLSPTSRRERWSRTRRSDSRLRTKGVTWRSALSDVLAAEHSQRARVRERFFARHGSLIHRSAEIRRLMAPRVPSGRLLLFGSKLAARPGGRTSAQSTEGAAICEMRPPRQRRRLMSEALVRPGPGRPTVRRRSVRAVCVVQNVEAIVSKRLEFCPMLGGTSPAARSAPRTRSP